MNKKIMTVMLKNNYGLESRGPAIERSWFADNLEKMGHRLERIWVDDYLGNPESLADHILHRAETFQPDLIWYFTYLNEISPEAVRRVSRKYKTAAWFGDDSWRFESFTSQLAPAFSHCITTDLWVTEKYHKINVQPIVSQWASDEPTNSFDPNTIGENCDLDVTFVGLANESRRWFVDRLKKHGVNVDCYGFGWENGSVKKEQMGEIFYRSKINLNISNSINHEVSFVFATPRNFAKWMVNKKSAEQIKARNFEIPLAGGFQLTNFVSGLEYYFNIGHELAAYHNAASCADMIRYFLDNSEHRTSIAKAGYQRARTEHTYQIRIQNILNAIFEVNYG